MMDGEKMKVTEKDIKTVATLSRLSVSEEEMPKYVEQLESILTYVDRLSELDTENIQPTTYALPMQNVFREDVVKPSIDRDLALSNAPLKEDGYFKVPKILED